MMPTTMSSMPAKAERKIIRVVLMELLIGMKIIVYLVVQMEQVLMLFH